MNTIINSITLKQKLLIVFIFASIIASPFPVALAASPPPLAPTSLLTADSFAVLGGTTVTSTGLTVINGDLGVSPGTAYTGFGPGIVVGGAIHANDGVAVQAQKDATIAYGDLFGLPPGSFLTGQNLGGLTLLPGVYTFTSSAFLTGDLTLDAKGDPNAFWVFQIGSTLDEASYSSVKLINGGQACNVFWQVGSSATLGTYSTFIGNILAYTSITLTTNTALSGRALAQNGAVTMDTNSVVASSCAGGSPIPPALGKSFNPSTIGAGSNSTLTIALSNTNATDAILSSALIDNLPAGVVVASPSNAGSTCGGGQITAGPGTSTVTLSAGSSIPANTSCWVTVDVTAASGGNYDNSLAAGALQTSNGNNVSPALATLTVNPLVAAPSLGKAFTPATISAGGNSTLTITLSNTDTTVAILSSALIDTLPPGLVVASPSNAGSTCGGGQITAGPGTSTVTLSAGSSIPASTSCTVTVNVTAGNSGNYDNTLAKDALQTSNGSNAGQAVATLTVNQPATVPTLGKAFSPATISAGGKSTLTITLSNTDTTNANLTSALVDTLPPGLVVASPSNAGSTCGGGQITAGPGTSTVTLSAGSAIPASTSCTVTVDVTAASGGNYVNSLAANALETTNGSNATPGFATLTVTPLVAAPMLGKAFTPATISAGSTSKLTITLSNPETSTVAILSSALIDTLPPGLVVASPSNAGSTCGGGQITAGPGTSTVTLSAGSSIPVNSFCTVTVNVTAGNSGNYPNTLATNALQTNNGNNASPAFATLTVTQLAAGPTLGKTFTPATISAGGKSTLTITLNNPSNTVANLIAQLIDRLPSGLIVAAKPNATTTCTGKVTPDPFSNALQLKGWTLDGKGTKSKPPVQCSLGGLVNAIAGGSTVALSAGSSIPANGSCTVTVDVTTKQNGCYTNYIFTNKLPAGALQTNQGNNTNPAFATLTIKDKKIKDKK